MELIFPINTSLLQRNNISQVNQTPFKYKNILLINLIIFISIIFSIYLYYYKFNNSFSHKTKLMKLTNEYLLYENNNYNYNNFSYRINSSDKNNELLFYKELNYIKNSKLNSFSTPTFYQITKERYLYEKQKQSIISNLVTHQFSGNWYILNNSIKDKNLFLIGNSNKGEAIFKFEKAFEMRSREDSIALVMKNKEGKYIDHWIKTTSYSKYQSLNMKINKAENTFKINGRFLTEFEKGEIFQTKYKKEKKCSTLINMTFPLIYEDVNATLFSGETIYLGSVPSLNPDNFTLIINSTCGFNIKVEGRQYDIVKEREIKTNKLNKLFHISIFSCMLYLIGVFFLVYGVKTTEMAISTLNIECFILISAWNFYIFASCIYLSFNGYIEYFLFFFLIGVCSLIKFIFFDTLIFYTFWGIKERIIENDCLLIKLKLRFYGFLFLIFFSIFFVVPTFLTNYFLITFICVLLWIPQIVHNIISNNRYGYPFIYILACTFDRIVYPFYFRGYKNNLFMLKVNNFIFQIIILLVLISIIILLIQTFRGPRFMLSEDYQSFPYGFYKNKDELINDCKDINNEECVICLCPIFEEEKEKINKMVEMEELSSSTDLSKDENNNNITNNSEIKESNDSDISKTDNNTKDTNDIKTEENIIDINLLKAEEESDNNDDNNLLLKEGNNSIENKDERGYFIKNKEEIINFVKSIRNVLLTVPYFLKLFFRKNFLFFYKSSANIHNKLYMLTPCKHIFHSDCLEKWLEQKKECPNCRTSFENLI